MTIYLLVTWLTGATSTYVMPDMAVCEKYKLHYSNTRKEQIECIQGKL